MSQDQNEIPDTHDSPSGPESAIDALVKQLVTAANVQTPLDEPPESDADKAERLARDEIEAGSRIVEEIFGSANCSPELARAASRLDHRHTGPQVTEFYTFESDDIKARGFI